MGASFTTCRLGKEGAAPSCVRALVSSLTLEKARGMPARGLGAQEQKPPGTWKAHTGLAHMESGASQTWETHTQHNQPQELGAPTLPRTTSQPPA